MKCCEMMYGMGDLTGVSVSLGDEIFSGGKKCRKSNIGDSDNTGDGGKIVGGAIGGCGGIGVFCEAKLKGAYLDQNEEILKIAELSPIPDPTKDIRRICARAFIKKLRLTNSQYSISMLSTYTISMKIN
ncbi:hypothetical protein Tco_0558241 [Tanacetum coccineum]